MWKCSLIKNILCLLRLHYFWDFVQYVFDFWMWNWKWSKSINANKFWLEFVLKYHLKGLIIEFWFLFQISLCCLFGANSQIGLSPMKCYDDFSFQSFEHGLPSRSLVGIFVQSIYMCSFKNRCVNFDVARWWWILLDI